jgi:hypothetical protein
VLAITVPFIQREGDSNASALALGVGDSKGTPQQAHPFFHGSQPNSRSSPRPHFLQIDPGAVVFATELHRTFPLMAAHFDTGGLAVAHRVGQALLEEAVNRNLTSSENRLVRSAISFTTSNP